MKKLILFLITTIAAQCILNAQQPPQIDSGWYYIQSKISNFYLDVYWGHRAPGTKVDQAETKHPSQVWKFVPDGKGNYYIQTNISGLDLHVREPLNIPKDTPGLPVEQGTRDPNKVWRLTQAGPGYYWIQYLPTARYLDVTFANHDNGGAVGQATPDPQQVWKFIPEPHPATPFPDTGPGPEPDNRSFWVKNVRPVIAWLPEHLGYPTGKSDSAAPPASNAHTQPGTTSTLILHILQDVTLQIRVGNNADPEQNPWWSDTGTFKLSKNDYYIKSNGEDFWLRRSDQTGWDHVALSSGQHKEIYIH